jgi:peroxiredoxin
MLAPGDPLPDLTLFGVDAEPVALTGLGAVLIAFYLYDWTGT